MNIEEKVKINLLARGFDNKTQLNNRGLIGATIDETILEIVKNLRIADVIKSVCPSCGSLDITIDKEKTHCLTCMDAWQTVL
jgi:hypothetical protein